MRRVQPTASSRIIPEVQLTLTHTHSRSHYPTQVTSSAEQSVMVQKEKDRLALFRKKTHAALVIQLAWRRYTSYYTLI